FRPPARGRFAAVADRRRGGRMTLPPRASLPSLIPESAPFSAEQRVWLNGLFAGLLSLEDGITALSLDQAAALLPVALDLAAPASAETPSKIPTPAAATVAPAGAPGCSRECPTAARFLSRTRLNKAASEKETWHIEFDLTATGIDYAVGDAFGVFPTNDPVLA